MSQFLGPLPRPAELLHTLSTYHPPRESEVVWIDQRSATFQTQAEEVGARIVPYLLKNPKEGWVNYAAFQDHSSLFLSDDDSKAVFKRARDWEASALKWNILLKLRLIHLGAILLYATLSHVGGVKWGKKVTAWTGGQGMTPWLWGTAAGLAIQELASPLIVGSALMHTFLIRGSLGQLLKKGTLPFFAHCSWIFACSAQSRLKLYRGWQERQTLEERYKTLWDHLGKYLDTQIAGAIEMGNHGVEILHQQIKPLVQAKMDQLYGGNKKHFDHAVLSHVERVSHLQEFVFLAQKGQENRFSLTTLLQAKKDFEETFKNNLSKNFEAAFALAYYYASFDGPAPRGWEGMEKEIEKLKTTSLTPEQFTKFVEGKTGGEIGASLPLEHQKILDCYWYAKGHLAAPLSN